MAELITLTNAAQLTELARIRRGWITQVRWSPRGTLAVASADGVHLYNTPNAVPIHCNEHHGPVKSIAFDVDGKLLFSASADTSVRAWQLDIQESLPLIRHNHSVEAVAYHETVGIASGSADGEVRISDSLQAIVLGKHTAEVSSVAFLPDSKLLASGGRDNTVRLWDVQSHEQRAVLQHDDWVREVVFSPDGTLIASACKDGSVNFWDVASGEKRLSLQAHTKGADCLAFNQNGLLATGGRDNLIKLWNYRHQLLTTLTAHTKPVLSLAFSPNGHYLASGSGDNTVRIWGVSDQ